jgi:hypothetical protein
VANALSYGCIFAYIAGSPVVIIGQMGLSSTVFAGVFAFTAIALAAGAWTSGRLSRGGIETTVLLDVSLPVAAAAALALWTGRGADNFVPGLITNALYGTAMVVAALIGWSIIGLAVGFLMGEGTSWRSDRRKRRAFFWLGLAWGALFLLRLAVQLPLYLTDQVTLLGTLKLVMGLPLFAPMVAVTWLVVRALYRRAEEDTEGIPLVDLS